MMDKLKSYIGILKTKVLALEAPIIGIVIGYLALIIVLILTYFGFWLYRCYAGQIVLSDLLAIIKEVTGPSMVACITFIAGCFVDLDGNGIPDKFERSDNKNGTGK